ncbi:MAG: patatin-like phospholipase family protein [Reyranellaceae bacterium]
MRVLSLDGGGSWAILQIQALIDLYPQARTGHDVLRQFDFVVANSGGTIVLAALIENYPLSQIEALFLDAQARKEIFFRLPWWKRIPRIIGLGPRYDSEEKIKGLLARMPLHGKTPITELGNAVTLATGRPFDFLMTTFDYDRRRAVFQRSDANSMASSASRPPPPHQQRLAPTLAEAVHSATNAPVDFFDKPARFLLWDSALNPAANRHRRFWDGAIGGYNNPTLAGLVEVLARPNAPPADAIRVLSIGTASVVLPYRLHYPGAPGLLVQELPEQGLLKDIKALATAILDDPPDAASFIAHVWLSGALPARDAPPVTDSPVVRMNPLVQPLRTVNGNLALPNGVSAAEFEKLRELEMDAVEQDQVLLIQRFGRRWLADDVTNQAIRANSVTLEPQIGFNRYSDAKAAWLARAPFR